jgi:hypothetical protein
MAGYINVFQLSNGRLVAKSGSSQNGPFENRNHLDIGNLPVKQNWRKANFCKIE